jgi:hypothetical protein
MDELSEVPQKRENRAQEPPPIFRSAVRRSPQELHIMPKALLRIGAICGSKLRKEISKSWENFHGQLEHAFFKIVTFLHLQVQLSI